MSLPEFAQSQDPRRRRQRTRTLLRGKLAYGDPQITLGCVIRNVSAEGAMIDAELPTLLPRQLLLLHVTEGAIYEAEIIWHRGSRMGLAFNARHEVQTTTDPQFRGLQLLWRELAPR